MKKKLIGSFALVILLAAGSHFYARAAEQKAKPEMITGQIQCLYCYAAGEDMGSDPVGCVTRCITKKNMPAIIVDDATGEIYVAVWKNGESAVPKLAPLAGKKINAQGIIHRKKGLNVIEIQIVAEAM